MALFGGSGANPLNFGYLIAVGLISVAMFLEIMEVKIVT